MTNAAMYLRISLDAAGDGLAVERQREDCLKLIESRGWSLVETYEDRISASDAKKVRPSYDRMVADFDAGRFEAIVCWDLDRLTRQPRQLEDWIDAAESRGLKLITANGEADLTTDGGIMYAGIKAQVARAEVRRKGARQKAANSQRMLSGDVYGRRLTWGWLDLGCRVLDPSAAPLIRQAVADVLTGKSTLEVAREWNGAGIMAPGGKPWLSTTVRSTLLRPANAGIVAYKDVEHRDVTAKWTPLFDVATYDALRATLKLRGSATGVKPRSTKYLMRNLATCGKCGSNMQGTWQKSGVNYICSGRAHHCSRAVRAKVLDDAALRFTARAILMARPTDYLSQEHVDRLGEIGVELEQLRAERDECAGSSLGGSSKVAWFSEIDRKEEALRAESVDLMKDSSMASLLRGLLPQAVDGRATFERALERRAEVETRLRQLPIRQQRMLVAEFGSYVVLDRNAKPRVQITELHPVEEEWEELA